MKKLFYRRKMIGGSGGGGSINWRFTDLKNKIKDPKAAAERGRRGGMEKIAEGTAVNKKNAQLNQLINYKSRNPSIFQARQAKKLRAKEIERGKKLIGRHKEVGGKIVQEFDKTITRRPKTGIARDIPKNVDFYGLSRKQAERIAKRKTKKALVAMAALGAATAAYKYKKDRDRAKGKK